MSHAGELGLLPVFQADLNPVPIDRPAPDVRSLERPLPVSVAILEIGIDKHGRVVSACVLRGLRGDFNEGRAGFGAEITIEAQLLRRQPVGAAVTVTFESPPRVDKR